MYIERRLLTEVQNLRKLVFERDFATGWVSLLLSCTFQLGADIHLVHVQALLYVSLRVKCGYVCMCGCVPVCLCVCVFVCEYVYVCVCVFGVPYVQNSGDLPLYVVFVLLHY